MKNENRKVYSLWIENEETGWELAGLFSNMLNAYRHSQEFSTDEEPIIAYSTMTSDLKTKIESELRNDLIVSRHSLNEEGARPWSRNQNIRQ